MVKRKRDNPLDVLPWKKVDVERIDDFEGFYELEEVDGAGVEIKDGKLTFNEKAKKKNKPAGSKDTNKSKTTEKTSSGTKGKSSKKSAAVFEDLSPEELYAKPKPKPKLKPKTKAKTNPKPVESTRSDDEEDEQVSSQKHALSSRTANPFESLENLEATKDEKLVKWKFEEPYENVTLSLSTQKALGALGFNKPTDIQLQAIPLLLQGHDVIGKAATGSGKTLAYGIPILEKHESLVFGGDRIKKHPTALIFAPTRELVHQICKHLESLYKYFSFGGSGIVSITGGLSIQKQQRLIKHNPAVIVATPGRFLDILKTGGNEMVSFMGDAEILVLDEADRLIQDGHFQDLEYILDLIGRGKSKRGVRQTMVFSATFQRDLFGKLGPGKKRNSSGPMSSLASNEDAIQLLTKKLHFKDKPPRFVDANPAENVAKSVLEAIVECSATEKDLYLYYFLLTYPARSIVFINSIETAKKLTKIFRELRMRCFDLHSELSQKERLTSLERFAENDVGILMCTDVAARGLDIPLVSHVIHYHLPRTADMYVHRSGRTARAGNKGISLLICSPEEASGPLIKLKRVLQHNHAIKTFDVDYNLLSRLKDRVSIAQKLVGSKVEGPNKGRRKTWFKEAADDLGVDLDELDEEEQSKKPDNYITKDEQKALRAQLKSELNRQVGYQGKYLTHGKNLAQLLVTGKSHQSFVGRAQTTALQDMGK